MYEYDASVQLSAGAAIALGLVALAFAVLMIAAIWRVFSKAGQPGWAAIIPIYNMVVLLRVVGRPWWWILLMLIPFVNFVLVFIIYIDLARSFGHGTGFGVLMVFFSWICIPILGFGSARYLGPAGSPNWQPPYPGQYPGGGGYPGGPYQQQPPYPGQPYQGNPYQQPYQGGPYQQQPYQGGPYQQQPPYPQQPYPQQPYPQQPPYPGQPPYGYPGQQPPPNS